MNTRLIFTGAVVAITAVLLLTKVVTLDMITDNYVAIGGVLGSIYLWIENRQVAAENKELKLQNKVLMQKK